MNRVEFFNTLYQFCEGLIEFRVFGKDRALIDPSNAAAIDSFCEKNQKENIYLGVGTRDGKGGEKAFVVNTGTSYFCHPPSGLSLLPAIRSSGRGF